MIHIIILGAEQGREAFNKILLSGGKGDNNELNDSCLQQGYSRDNKLNKVKEPYEGIKDFKMIGSSSKSKCFDDLSGIFSKEKNRSCDSAKDYTFKCTPTFVVSSPNFLVFENVYYVSSAVGVKSFTSDNIKDDKGVPVFPLITSPKEIHNAAVKVCDLNWDDLQKSYPVDGQPKDTNIKW